MRGSATAINDSRNAKLAKLRAEVERLRVALDEFEQTDPEVEPDLEQISYSVPRAARVMDISERKVWELVKSGEIQSYTVGTARRISRTALLEYVERQQEAAA